jgi:hypothetical protein
MRFDDVVHREILYLLPDHGRVIDLERAAESIGFMSRIVLRTPYWYMAQRISMARVCFKEDVVVLNAATSRWRFGVAEEPVEAGTKALYPSICWAAYPKRMILSPRLLAPVQTWENLQQHRLQVPDGNCQCW